MSLFTDLHSKVFWLIDDDSNDSTPFPFQVSALQNDVIEMHVLCSSILECESLRFIFILFSFHRIVFNFDIFHFHI